MGLTGPRQVRLARAALAVVAAAVLVGIAACAGTAGASSGDDPLSIVATTNVVAASATEVVGDDAEVTALMGPGVDPHQYRPRAGDLATLRGADLVLAVGLDLEGSLLEVLRGLGDSTPVVFVGEEVPDDLLLPADDAPDGEVHDPHVWFDVTAWVHAVAAIGDAVAGIDPDLAATVTTRTREHLDDLDDLHEELSATYATIPDDQRVVVTSHDAFRYLGRAYDLEVVGIQGISTAAEATTDAVQEVADVIVEHDLPAVFVESSVDPRTVEAVVAAAERAGARGRDGAAGVEVGDELYSDSAGAPGTPEATYAGMLRANARTIAEHLGGGEPAP